MSELLFGRGGEAACGNFRKNRGAKNGGSFTRRTALLATACVLAASIAMASSSGEGEDQHLKEMSLEQLGNVVVTSVSKEPEAVWKTPAAIYVITQDDIRRSGATSLPEVLRLVPGLEVARADSDHWSVGVRGFGSQFSRSVLVLVDGRSTYTPLFEGVYWDVQNMMLEDIERIEVIRGPGGTIWGSNAVNGVINIITKNAKDTKGTLVAVGGGNVDQATGGARFGGAIGDKVDYRVYGTGFIRGAEEHADGDPYDEWRTGQMGFRADWKGAGKDSFTLQGDIYSGSSGQRTAIGFFNPPAQEVLDNESFNSGGNVVARWRRELSESSDVRLEAYFDRTNRQGVQFGETRNTFDVDFMHHVKIGGRNDFLWGAGVRLSRTISSRRRRRWTSSRIRRRTAFIADLCRTKLRWSKISWH